MVPRPHVSAVQLAGRQPSPLAIEGRLDAATLLRHTPHRQEWDLVVAEPTLLAFHTAFYPGWEARVDGRRQGVEPLAGAGLVGLRLEPGAHRVALAFGATPVRRYASWAAIAGLALWLALVALAARERLRARPLRRVETGALITTAMVVVWLALAPLALRPDHAAAQANAGPLVMDFARAPYLHPEPEGVYFGESLLLDYALDATHVAPGDEVPLSTRWAGAAPDAQLRVQLSAATAHLYQPAPAWAETSTPLREGEVTLTLRLPPDIPPGLYVLRMNVLVTGQPQAIRSAGGYGMHELALQPLQVVGQRIATGEEDTLGTFGPEHRPAAVALVNAEGSMTGDMAEVALTWRSESQAPLNYMLSVRLRRADGEMIANRDLPPLLGGYPTLLWRPGALYTDRVLLPLPEGAALASGDRLEVVLYDRLTLQGAGSAEVTLP
jgi:hypothetical protein